MPDEPSIIHGVPILTAEQLQEFQRSWVTSSAENYLRLQQATGRSIAEVANQSNYPSELNSAFRRVATRLRQEIDQQYPEEPQEEGKMTNRKIQMRTNGAEITIDHGSGMIHDGRNIIARMEKGKLSIQHHHAFGNIVGQPETDQLNELVTILNTVLAEKRMRMRIVLAIPKVWAAIATPSETPVYLFHDKYSDQLFNTTMTHNISILPKTPEELASCTTIDKAVFDQATGMLAFYAVSSSQQHWDRVENGVMYTGLEAIRLRQTNSLQTMLRFPLFARPANLRMCSHENCHDYYMDEGDNHNEYGMCPRCVAQHVGHVCHICHEEIHPSFHVEQRYEGQRIHVHQACFDSRCMSCAQCGDTHLRSTDETVFDIMGNLDSDEYQPGQWLHSRNRWWCPEHAEQELFRSEDIHGYHSDERNFDFIGTGPVYAGLEIEVDEGSERPQLCKKLRKLWRNNIILERDGSLSDRGMEAVCPPISFDTIIDYQPLVDTVELMKAHGFKGQKANRSCGMHINVGHDHLTGEERDRIRGIVYRFSPEFTALSQRKKGHDYARMPWIAQQSGDWSAEYRHIITDDDTASSMFRGSDHYAGVSDKGDIFEFRFFAMSLNIKSIFAKVELIKNLYYWVENKDGDPHTIDDILYCQPTKYLLEYAARYLKKHCIPSATWLEPEQKERLHKDIVYAAGKQEVVANHIKLADVDRAALADGFTREDAGEKVTTDYVLYRNRTVHSWRTALAHWLVSTNSMNMMNNYEFLDLNGMEA